MAYKNAIGNKCSESASIGNISISSDEFSASGGDIKFQPSDYSQVIIDTSTPGKNMKLQIENRSTGNDNSPAYFKINGATSYIRFNNSANGFQLQKEDEHFRIFYNPEATSGLCFYINLDENTINRWLQSVFLRYNKADVSNATGDGTSFRVYFDYTLENRGEDFSTTTYTSPEDAILNFNISVTLQAIGSSNNGVVSLVTSNRTYNFGWIDLGQVNESSGHSYTLAFSTLCYMDAGDTAEIYVAAYNQAKTIGVMGDQIWVYTYVSGNLES